MKKVLFSLLVAGLPLTAVAGNTPGAVRMAEPVLKTIAPLRVDAVESKLFDLNKGASVLADSKRGIILDSASFTDYSFESRSVNPLAFDPYSGTLFFAQRTVQAPLSGSTVTRGQLFVRNAKIANGQATWGANTSVFLKEGTYPVNPSIAIVNATKSSNVNDVSFITYAMQYVAQGTSTPFAGGLWVKNKSLTSTPVPEEHANPLENPQDPVQWWVYSKGIGNVENGKPYIYFGGNTEPSATGGVFGWYGFSRNEMTTDGMETIENDHLQAWAPDQFMVPADPTAGSYANPVELDTDPEGTVYSCFYNLMPGKDFERNVMVKKSTGVGSDGKLTWGAWDSLPNKTIVDYQTSMGMDTLIGDRFAIMHYGETAFIVTGKDEFSFFCPTFITKLNASKERDYYYYLVEVYKKAGVWGIRNVAPLSGQYVFELDYNTTQNDFVLRESPRDYNISAARTADGKNIVVKWIDLVDTKIYPKYSVQYYSNSNYTPQKIDSLNTTDVFTNYKAVSDNEWLEKNIINQTDDAEYDKITIMPKIISDIKNVPMISMITNVNKFSSASDAKYTKDMPADFIRLAWDHYQNFYFKVYDATTTTSGVNDNNTEVNSSFGIVPNPNNGVATINVNLTESGTAVVRVYNEMGQLVKEIANGSFNAGAHNLSLNASDLANGSYIVTVTVNGVTETKHMSVVK
eukprot:TRINITY_DN12902_c0_g1_i1.p1 TRINITY_DN12902_c0_g1~~TRINITY_DN12902_c0_g1_i1.p1  ORF type:complete len:687 (-),score=-53.56 TRINITY_DN12902_c0_g1_i1:32-2092(-)